MAKIPLRWCLHRVHTHLETTPPQFQIYKAIKAIDPEKLAKPNRVTPNLLKVAADFSVECIAKISNRTLQTNLFSNQRKAACAPL